MCQNDKNTSPLQQNLSLFLLMLPNKGASQVLAFVCFSNHSLMDNVRIVSLRLAMWWNILHSDETWTEWRSIHFDFVTRKNSFLTFGRLPLRTITQNDIGPQIPLQPEYRHWQGGIPNGTGAFCLPHMGESGWMVENCIFYIMHCQSCKLPF